MPTNEEEAEKLNIINLQDYLNFVDNYLTNKNIFIEILCLNSKNMKCDRFSTVISNEEEIVIFNTKYVYYNNSFDKVRDAA